MSYVLSLFAFRFLFPKAIKLDRLSGGIEGARAMRASLFRMRNAGRKRRHDDAMNREEEDWHTRIGELWVRLKIASKATWQSSVERCVPRIRSWCRRMQEFCSFYCAAVPKLFQTDSSKALKLVQACKRIIRRGKRKRKGEKKGHSVRLRSSRGDKARGRAACVHKQLLVKRPPRKLATQPETISYLWATVLATCGPFHSNTTKLDGTWILYHIHQLCICSVWMRYDKLVLGIDE